MSNKKLVRVIIYEGPEEIIDRYEIRNVMGTIQGGIPPLYSAGRSHKELTNDLVKKLKENNIPPFVKITAETILTVDHHNPNDPEAEFELMQQNLLEVLEKHDNATIPNR